MQDTYLLDDALLGRDRVAILKLVLGEVDLREWALVLDLVNGLLYLSLCPAHRSAAARRTVVGGDGETVETREWWRAMKTSCAVQSTPLLGGV